MAVAEPPNRQENPSRRGHARGEPPLPVENSTERTTLRLFANGEVRERRRVEFGTVFLFFLFFYIVRLRRDLCFETFSNKGGMKARTGIFRAVLFRMDGNNG